MRRAATAARSTIPPGATSSPQRSHDRVPDLVVGVQLVHDRVGRQGRRAEALQCRERLGLPRADPARQADERRPTRLLGVGGLVLAGGLGLGRLGLGLGFRGRPRPRAGLGLGLRAATSAAGSASASASASRGLGGLGSAAGREDVLGQAQLRHVVEVAGVALRASAIGSSWPSTRLTDSDRRRRSESISRIFTLTSSPGATTSRGFST